MSGCYVEASVEAEASRLGASRLGVEVSRILYVDGGWSQGEKRRGCRGCVEAASRPHVESDVEARRRGRRGQGSDAERPDVKLPST